MVGILSACPELRILRLQNMTFWNHELVHYEPVPLKHLEVLDVTGLKPDGFAVLLPILAPGPGELSLRVNLTSRDDDSEALTAFFLRSNIVRLFLQGWERRRFRLAQHLNPLKNLRVLVFDLNNDSEPMDGEQKLDVLIDPPNCDNAALCSSQWPQLRTLYLINGKISPDTVRSVVESCRIQKLRIASCHMDGLDEEVEQWFQSVVQDVRCDLGLDRRILVRDWYKHMW
ncbi:hypothetical protein BDV93DRAFT_121691 [Ceratobasidium sp. AG-I]|nr:hypothetical protein BDV93DRAFT_121691 [Ceratobasidium sp. AG-I]